MKKAQERPLYGPMDTICLVSMPTQAAHL